MTNRPNEIERRAFTRHRARTKVFVKQGEISKLCTCVDLSAGGCAVKTDGLGLKPNSTATLTFAIYLGDVIKLHRRIARVVHVRNGLTGFALQAYGQDYGHVKAEVTK